MSVMAILPAAARPIRNFCCALGLCRPQGALFAASNFTVAIGGFAISQAYNLAAATTVAPFEYLALPFAVLWGYLIWGDFSDLFTFLGIALIVVGGLTVILRSRAVA